jgi:hypothetical protein
MKTYGGVEVSVHAFLTLVLDAGEWSTPSHGRLAPDTHRTGGWVGSEAGRDAVEKREKIPSN